MATPNRRRSGTGTLPLKWLLVSIRNATPRSSIDRLRRKLFSPLDTVVAHGLTLRPHPAQNGRPLNRSR